MYKSIMSFLLTFSFAIGMTQTNSDGIVGSWAGLLDIGPQKLTLILHIEQDGDQYRTTLDSPDQKATGIPTDATTFAEGQLTVKASALQMTYTATLAADGQSLEGMFEQGGASLPLVLNRGNEANATATRRPQDPIDFPYTQEEVAISVPGHDHQLAGTLTLPADQPPVAGVILVSGSGPQDRDEALLGHRPFLVLSDYLTRHGIAVLRYDDRGVGQSGGDFATATTAHLTIDATAVLTYLKNRPELAGRKVGIIGHSEGGMIAPLVAMAQPDLVDLAVLLAGPGIASDSLLVLQIDRGAAAQGAPAAARAANAVLLTRVFDYIPLHPELSEAELHTALTDMMIEGLQDFPVEVRNSIPDQRAFAEGEAKAFTGTWFRYFIGYDPVDALRQLTCPVLALNGSLDLQVTVPENTDAMQQIWTESRHPDATVVVLPGLNHLFQPATTGATSEYGTIATTFDEKTMGLIVDWIHRRR